MNWWLIRQFPHSVFFFLSVIFITLFVTIQAYCIRQFCFFVFFWGIWQIGKEVFWKKLNHALLKAACCTRRIESVNCITNDMLVRAHDHLQGDGTVMTTAFLITWKLCVCVCFLDQPTEWGHYDPSWQLHCQIVLCVLSRKLSMKHHVLLSPHVGQHEKSSVLHSRILPQALWWGELSTWTWTWIYFSIPNSHQSSLEWLTCQLTLL